MTTGPLAIRRKASVMKTLLAAAVAASLAVVLGSPAALAEGPKPSSAATVAQTRDSRFATDRTMPHYEWQYHYVGRHARLEGYWALVR